MINSFGIFRQKWPFTAKETALILGAGAVILTVGPAAMDMCRIVYYYFIAPHTRTNNDELTYGIYMKA